jgi:hypothetical protein
MLVVKVELHNANTGKVSEISRVVIYNDETGTAQMGNYRVCLARVAETDNRRVIADPTVLGRVERHPRQVQHVLCLVRKAIAALGFEE